MDELVLTDPADVVAALAHPALEPPQLTGPGATLALRAQMARFSGATNHAPRRSAAIAAIEQLDPAHAAVVAMGLAASRMDGRPIDLIDGIGRIVPTETLAMMLGVNDGLAQVVADVEAAVRVIGRGEPPTAAADAAVRRLRDRFGGHEMGWVPVVSVLYQGFDATMWLLAVTVHSRAASSPPVAAVPRTRRIAAATIEVAGRRLEQGDAVVLEIGAAGLPYGSGSHQCPGSRLAEHIVDGIIDAVDRGGYVVDLDGVRLDADGRPVLLPLVGR